MVFQESEVLRWEIAKLKDDIRTTGENAKKDSKAKEGLSFEMFNIKRGAIFFMYVLCEVVLEGHLITELQWIQLVEKTIENKRYICVQPVTL